jgi:Dodecin
LPERVAEAMRSGVTHTDKTRRQIDRVEVHSIRGHVKGDEILRFQVGRRCPAVEGSRRPTAVEGRRPMSSSATWLVPDTLAAD